MQKNIRHGGACSTGMYPWGSSLSFFTIFEEGIFEWGKNYSERVFGQRLSSARLVIEWAFEQLKTRFGCLRREMAINLKELPAVIHVCFILHNLCEFTMMRSLLETTMLNFSLKQTQGMKSIITRLVVKGSETSLLNILNK